MPPELHGLQVRSAFYDLVPAGVEFAAPVTVARRISFEALNLDPAEGIPILVLAIRSADGMWQWMANQKLTRSADFVIVSGQTQHTGTIFAFGGRATTKTEVTDGAPVQVGSALRITATLTFPEDSFDPPLLGLFEPITDADFVQVGDADGPDNQNLSQAFVCAAPGSTTVGIRYDVLNVGAESALFEQLDLAPAATQVEVTAELTCAAPSVPASP